MGSHYSAFLGPYVRCSVRTEPSTKKITVCTKEGCRFNRPTNPMVSSFKFCPQCGSTCQDKTVEIEGEVDASINQWDVVRGTEESLTGYNMEYPEKGIHLFVSNNINSPGVNIEDECGEISNYNGLAIDLELTQFRDRHAKDLEVLYTHYGEDKVEVCWGVLGEYN